MEMSFLNRDLIPGPPELQTDAVQTELTGTIGIEALEMHQMA